MLPELEYRVLDRFPNFFYCDPDYYPVGRGDEQELAVERFPSIRADDEEYNAITSHLGLPAGSIEEPTPEQKLLVYREHKKLAALLLEPANGKFAFTIRISDDGSTGKTVEGTVDRNGVIFVSKTADTFVTCPICLARGTLIETPQGVIRVEAVRPDTAVWTADEHGARIAAVVVAVAKTGTAPAHQMVRLRLDDGRELEASPGHPTGDGRVVGNLKAGDLLDGAHVASALLVPYGQAETYDLLPSGPTGAYWANGVLLGSTLGVRWPAAFEH